jgi:hypothetical protein
LIFARKLLWDIELSSAFAAVFKMRTLRELLVLGANIRKKIGFQRKMDVKLLNLAEKIEDLRRLCLKKASTKAEK